jgi:EF-P beta-lysylation protein EpmB
MGGAREICVVGSPDEASRDWRRSLAEAIRSRAELLQALGLPVDADADADAEQAAERFPVLVPRSYLARMRPGDPRDPLLLQVAPVARELTPAENFTSDPVGDVQARLAPGLLHKYPGRALLVLTGTCAVHCRYCFRREYPYADEPRRLEDWAPALAAIAADESLHEVLLSGGDPLVFSDARISQMLESLALIPHVRRVRVHTRLPIVLPERVTDELLAVLRGTRLQPVVVVHANHPRELTGDCGAALRRLVRAGVPTLNQTVLLAQINDDVETLAELCEALIDLGVLPYYLHQLDRVTGAAHFEAPEARGRELWRELHARLPGYAVPRYVREVPGAAGKTPLV